MCRSLPPEKQFSVSPIEKADPQIPLTRDGEVPTADTHYVKVSDDLRHIPAVEEISLNCRKGQERTPVFIKYLRSHLHPLV